MMTVYTYEEVLELIRKRQGEKTAKDFADELGISAAYLSDVYAKKRYPANKLLEPLGLVRTYGFSKVKKG